MTPVNRFQEALKKEIGRKTDYNKDLITEKNRLQGELISSPSRERERLSGTAIKDPTRREALAFEKLGGIRSNLGTVTDLLNARGQRNEDIISDAASRFAEMEQARRISGASSRAQTLLGPNPFARDPGGDEGGTRGGDEGGTGGIGSSSGTDSPPQGLSYMDRYRRNLKTLQDIDGSGETGFMRFGDRVVDNTLDRITALLGSMSRR